MNLNAAAVLHATGAPVVQVLADGEQISGGLTPADLQMRFSEAVMDSRAVSEDALFFALPGERVDGHEFVAEAFERGARACVVSRWSADDLARLQRHEHRDREKRLIFVATDVLTALQRLAAHWRRGLDVQVIGITGSVGKTTTKEIVSGVLARQRNVFRSEANLNTEIGMPLMLLRLRSEHSVAVLEMGMYHEGDIELLARVAAPEIGIVTNVGPMHLERMGSIERIAAEKSRLVAALPPDGLAILNGDNVWTRAMAITSGSAPAVLVGTSPDSDYRAEDVVGYGFDGISFQLVAECRQLPMRTHVPGTHTLHAILCAIAAGRRFGMLWEEIQAAISEVEFDARQRVLHGPDGMLIIDDSYNAAPVSMTAALDLLREAPAGKIAVLGDMLELGTGEEEAHRQIGLHAARIADWLVVRGPRGQWIAEGALTGGLSSNRVLRAESNAEAVARVRQIVTERGGVVDADSTRTMQGASPDQEAPIAWSVLVKGSRGMRMEEVVQGLRGDTCS